MADPCGEGWRKLARAGLALAMGASLGGAAGAAEIEDLAGWLARTTDLQRAQIVMVGPDSIYSLEPLGAQLPTGEVVALVRTEPLADDWRDAHGFTSWDASLLIDCGQRRLRMIRSATYPLRNRGGRPTPQAEDNRAVTPLRHEPAAKLIAAACDADYAWPLRGADVRAASTPQADSPPPPDRPGKVQAASGPLEILLPSAPASPASAAAAATPGTTTYAIQVARGPSEDGARRALAKARKALAPLTPDVRDALPTSRIPGDHMRFEARLEGFATEAAAQDACRKLTKAGQACFVLAPAGVAAGGASIGG